MISIVIPCRDAAPTIGNQLEALAGQSWTGAWEVVVGDNGSTDETISVLERYRRCLPRLKVVDASSRKGAAHARNVGARAASGESLAFVDADDEVSSGWLAAMAAALDQHRFVASRFAFDKLNPDWLLEALGAPQNDRIQRLWYPPYLPHSGGCGLGIRRELHESIGGFDESLPVLEDTDYCIRAQMAGAKLHFAADAVIQVRHRRAMLGSFRQASTWARYNGLMFRKYGGGQRLTGAWRIYLRDWRRLIHRLRRTRNRQSAASCAHQLGWQLGLLEACVLYQIPPVVSVASLPTDGKS